MHDAWDRWKVLSQTGTEIVNELELKTLGCQIDGNAGVIAPLCSIDSQILCGRQVLVFNCDEGIDFQSMGRIFIGLVRCRAWRFFDEVNRLLEEQMSAISQSVQLIEAAIKTHAKVVSLLGREITVNHNTGIFITMNPATKGYGGRQKLPVNLKQLFRPVAMSVPDNELIAEVMMLAQRIVALFLLSMKHSTAFWTTTTCS